MTSHLANFHLRLLSCSRGMFLRLMHARCRDIWDLRVKISGIYKLPIHKRYKHINLPFDGCVPSIFLAESHSKPTSFVSRKFLPSAKKPSHINSNQPCEAVKLQMSLYILNKWDSAAKSIYLNKILFKVLLTGVSLKIKPNNMKLPGLMAKVKFPWSRLVPSQINQSVRGAAHVSENMATDLRKDFPDMDVVSVTTLKSYLVKYDVIFCKLSFHACGIHAVPSLKCI